ncbi:amino acid/polyamine/organocation transporter, APC superfamily [Verrucomicrobium sp. GAS474]|uniref:APC family permease n=1 Tax=Verrucomicrobium sp. GAS474 TaxID=1882831 RepID=UPI00087D653C|nr:APC family permease [Verrucomicrobium sp. GAS474]SDT97659.1 amino acid/polyamine/organocation transporter, APC superfamily [Verrucomicrobium sp. GAS474]
MDEAPPLPGSLPPSRAGKLRSTCLSFPETLSQSVAAISPTFTAAANAAVVYSFAGNGTWITYLLACCGLLCVSFHIRYFARRTASPGSLYTYVAQTLGPDTGFVAGWCSVIAYLLTAMSVLIIAVDYLRHFKPLLAPPTLLILAASVLAVWYVAYRDIRFSARLMLSAEAFSVLLTLLIGALVCLRHGIFLDPAQFTLQGATPDGIKIGLIMAIFSFVGFESSTTLGTEDRDPLRNIPRSISWSVLGSGLFFIVISYVSILSFHTIGADLSRSDTPIITLTAYLGHPALGLLFSIGVIISAFACAIACINAGSRILFTLGRHGILPPRIAQTHRVNATPHHAITLSAILILLVPAGCILAHIPLIDIYGYLGTLATYGFLTVYAMIAVAAPLSLRQRGQLRLRHLLHSALSLLFLSLPIVGNLSSHPEPPFDQFPLWFLSALAVSLVGYACLRMKYRDEISERIEDDAD